MLLWLIAAVIAIVGVVQLIQGQVLFALLLLSSRAWSDPAATASSGAVVPLDSAFIGRCAVDSQLVLHEVAGVESGRARRHRRR